MKAKLLPYDSKREKYYGTRIGLFIDFEGSPRQMGNPLQVWFFEDWIGGNKPSNRESDKPDIAGHHYESEGNLAVAEWIVRALNNYAEPFPDLPFDMEM